MDDPEYIHYDLEFDLNNPYQPIDKEIAQMHRCEV